MSNTVIRTNTLALNAHRNLGSVGNTQARASRNLSSGFRINSAADDAAGLAISESMRAQIRGLNQASRNAQDGVSLLQTAEGFLSTVQELAQNMRELSVQGANDTYNETQRGFLAAEINQLRSEIIRIQDTAQFNGADLFGAGGHLEGSFLLQVGANTNQNIDVVTELGGSLGAINTLPAGITGAFSSGTPTQADFNTGIDTFQNFIDDVSSARAGLGAIINRLEFTIDNLDIASENLSASESRIRDADMASEMMQLTQANVLQQAATAMLAQANQAPQSVLQLIG
jgi:flagellin